MVMDDLCARGLPAASDDFPWPVLMHDGERILYVSPAGLRWCDFSVEGGLLQQPLSVLCRREDERALAASLGGTRVGAPPAAHPTAMWSVPVAPDRAGFLGEAKGLWLWALVWPATAGVLMYDGLQLSDLRDLTAAREVGFGSISPRLSAAPYKLSA